MLANQDPVGLVTKTMGAMHGCGRETVVLMCALPPPALASPVVAGTAAVMTFMVVPSLARQLTMAANEATGLAPVAARTSPCT